MNANFNVQKRVTSANHSEHERQRTKALDNAPNARKLDRSARVRMLACKPSQQLTQAPSPGRTAIYTETAAHQRTQARTDGRTG
ncbi:hypothetical protein GCM10010176_024700 [Nonomuraea spiralis]|nr:hypothetical protein GCM10010176_024700 [Nonomuraea spiralis]